MTLLTINVQTPTPPGAPLAQPRPAGPAQSPALAVATVAPPPVPNYATKPCPSPSREQHQTPTPRTEVAPTSWVSAPLPLHHLRPSVIVQQVEEPMLAQQEKPGSYSFADNDSVQSNVDHVRGYPLPPALPDSASQPDVPVNHPGSQADASSMSNAGMSVPPTGTGLLQPLLPIIDSLRLPLPVEHPRSARRVEDVEVLQRFSIEVELPGPGRNYKRHTSSGCTTTSLRSPTSARRSNHQEKPYDHGSRRRARKD